MNKKEKLLAFCCSITLFIIFLIVANMISESKTYKNKNDVIALESVSEEESVDYFEAVELDNFEWNVHSDFVPIDCILDENVQEFVYAMCKAYDMDFYLIMAQIEIESNYQSEIISSTNDYGLMQINICNHEWLSEELGITDFLDPYQSIKAGIYVMRMHIEKYDGNVEKALMAYNMGCYEAECLWNQGIHQTNYSTKILSRMKELSSEVGE